MSNKQATTNSPTTTTTNGKMSNFKLFSFLVKKRKKTSSSLDQNAMNSSDSDMMIDTSPRMMTSSSSSSPRNTPEYVDVNSKTSLGALSESSSSHVNPRNSARIIRRTDNEGFKNKVNNRKSAAFTKQQIVF